MHRARHLVLAIAATLPCACRPTAQPTTPTTNPASPAVAPSLDWIVGTWQANTPQGVVTEQWSHGEAGSLLGRSETKQGDTVVFFEQMRLQRADDGTVTFLAQPMGRTPATPFRAVPPWSSQQLTVENPDNEFPQRIEYRRDGDTLTATISGAGQRARWDYHRVP
ncbi:MAG: DUF6265 family protein [Nannocystaceae bacterium]